MALLGSQDAFGSDVEAKIRIYKKYWNSLGKTHIFDPKMAPRCRKMTPKSFQEPSWPLLDRSWGILGRSWRILGRSWGLLGRSGADLGRLRTILGRSSSLLRPILGVLGRFLGRSWAPKTSLWADYKFFAFFHAILTPPLPWGDGTPRGNTGLLVRSSGGLRTIRKLLEAS